MFRNLSLKVYALKRPCKQTPPPKAVEGGRSRRALLDALRVKNKSISASLLEARPALAVLRAHKSDVPWRGALDKSSTCLGTCPNKRKDRSG